MEDFDECKRIVREFNKGINQGDREAMYNVMGEDYVFHTFLGTIRGRDDVYKNLMEMREVFPDLEVTIDTQVADSDYVVNRVRMTGTHEGEFVGIPPTHKKVETTGIGMFRFEGDKIVEHWAEWNVMAVLGQLGALPDPPQE
jgi:steroid delta-isomerase-like uncharacterized protein